MERTGLIEREIRGKRTYRIVADRRPRSRPARPTRRAQARPAGRAGRPAAADGAGHDIGRDLAAASAVPGFDYDELARRLLVQLVRRLAVPAADRLPPGPAEGTASGRPVQAPAGPDPGPADSRPGDPGVDDAGLRQAVASLEQKLASAQSRQRKLTAENARLRQQLQAAQRSLAQAEERAGAGHLAGQLGSAEVLLLERLLSASRGQAAQQEDEAGAG